MTGGYVELEQARWDLQVATGQTVAGTGIEARMREARAASGRIAAGLPGLLDELEQLRRLPAELADARTEVGRTWALCDRYGILSLDEALAERDAAVERAMASAKLMLVWSDRALTAERALEAVREWAMVNEIAEPPLDWAGLGAALSAASPTASDDEATKTAAQLIREIAERDPEAHAAALARGYGIDRDPAHYPPAASDEPARCPHGKTEAHDVIVSGFPVSPWFRCPGPAASGTPETTL